MTIVKLSSVITCSSQDSRNPPSNLLKRSGGSWLCSPVDAKLNQIEVSLKLSESCVISNIDIGNHGSFSIEVLVSCDGNPYETLINQSTFMSVTDSRMGKNLHAVKMFKLQDFDSSNRAMVCDRIKLVCFQPHRKDKSFGIALLKVMTDSTNENVSPQQRPSKRMEEFMKQHQSAENKSSASEREAWLKGAVQGRLEQIANTGKISTADRSMRMVMASIKSPSHRTPLVNELLNQKSSPTTSRPTFMSSVRAFFRKLDYGNIDPYNMKVSDLRYQFEKLKARKLNKDEKKNFKEYTLDFFETRFGESSRESQNHAEGRAPVKKGPQVDNKTLKLAKELQAKLTQNTESSPRPPVPNQVKDVEMVVLDDNITDITSPTSSGSKTPSIDDFEEFALSPLHDKVGGDVSSVANTSSVPQNLDQSLKENLTEFLDNRRSHYQSSELKNSTSPGSSKSSQHVSFNQHTTVARCAEVLPMSTINETVSKSECSPTLQTKKLLTSTPSAPGTAVTTSPSIVSWQQASMTHHKQITPTSNTPQRMNLPSPATVRSLSQPVRFSTPVSTSDTLAHHQTALQQSSPRVAVSQKLTLIPPSKSSVRTPESIKTPATPILQLTPARSTQSTPKGKGNYSQSTPSSSESQPKFNRRSTAMSPTAYDSQLPRNEIRPPVKKRTIDELLSDDEDLMLPVSKNTTRDVSNVSLKSCGGSQLTLQDLLSSDDEDENFSAVNLPSEETCKHSVDAKTTSKHNTCNMHMSVTGAVKIPMSISQAPVFAVSKPAVDVVLSDGSEDLPDIAADSDNESLLPIFHSATRPVECAAEIDLAQCPICMEYFIQSEIEVHASDCIIE